MTRRPRLLLLLAAGLAGPALLAGCPDPKITEVETDFDFDGTCVRCHTGLSAKQVHPTFKLRCIDCHGGNDQVAEVPENAHETESVYRAPELVAASHVAPKSAALARFFFANGIDDDGDGVVDEGPAFDDLDGDGKLDPGETIMDPGEIPELGLQGEGVGQFIDSELNRDLDYTRWLNPGDLRVATASCGSRSAAAGGTGCHQSVIDVNRRSIMANNSAVINGAYYGNESWRETFKTARDDTGPADDPRVGAFGYMFAWDAIDECIVGGDGGEGGTPPSFDSECLEAKAAAADPSAAAGAPGNEGLPAFEATQGSATPVAPPGETLAHGGVHRTRYPWGGKPLGPATTPLAEMQPVPSEELAPGIPDPVDNILRGFRAYYPLNFPGSGNNFAFSFGESILPNFANLAFNNPFGRGHSSGCTGCHMAYDHTGARKPQKVLTTEGGRPVFTEVADPTTKHREFDPATQDIVSIDGADRLVGVAVNQAERELTQREQQRFYSESHTLTTRITTDTCGMCHSFVTRIDHSYRGMAEDEQRDAIARRAPITFATPSGTVVNILSSHVREEGPDPDTRTLIIPEGVAVIEAAKARDAALAEVGLLPNHGGCVPDVFTEDCNNNGELDTQLVLTRFGAGGQIIATTTINEDSNGNGQLDLVDRVPRERSVDGRQFKYVYGGANGATRLMDVHFEKGMHCIDCHFLQDTHGDGQIYSTNWEAIEIECEDCHGTLGQKATLVTSGQNGGNDLTRAVDHDGVPYFVKLADGTVFQRSRVEDGLAWRVPQVDDVITEGTPDYNPRAVNAMTIPGHMPDPVAAGSHTTGSTFEDGRLVKAEMECYSCHNSWIYNCLGCHYQMNLGDDIRVNVPPGGLAATAVAGENETWFNNELLPAKTDFQLLSLHRGPFVLGVNAAADGGRLAPFRSSMVAHVTVNDADGHTILDNVTFTTWQERDGNSGRANVATSGAANNQTMPHSVRVRETKDCDWCHAVVDQGGRVQNDGLLAQTYGLGAGRYPYVGDWILAAGASGLELFDIKDENQLPGSSGSSRFPGIIYSTLAGDRIAADVEPILDGTGGVTDAAFDATDVAFLRNFNPRPAVAGGTAPPTLRDLALVTLASASAGKLLVADVTDRGHPSAARPGLADADKVEVVDLPGRALGIATLSPDVSDPFVYVAGGSAGLVVVELVGKPGDAAVANVSAVGAGFTATAVALAGDVIYVGSAEGDVHVYDASDPGAPVHLDPISVGGEVRALQVQGFFLYAATANGLAVLDILEPTVPTLPAGASSALVLGGLDLRGLYVSGGHAFVAAGAAGVHDIDVSVPAAPVDLGSVVPAGETVDARDVIVSVTPGQRWLIVADGGGAGSLVLIKLDTTLNPRERCFPDPVAAGCGKDFDFRDPAIMGRDPSFDPVTQTFDAADPSGDPFQRVPAGVGGRPARLARPAEWEKIGTQTGRRMRDSFMPGSGVMSLEVMQRLRRVELCVVPGSADVDGNGLGELGYADDGFKQTGTCVPMNPP